MYWLPSDQAAFLYALLGALCIMGGILFFVVSAHWWADRIDLWWVWSVLALIAATLGCFIIGKG